MRFLFKNEVVSYNVFGNTHAETILLLHGWGMDKNAFYQTINLLKNHFKIITITMPTTSPTISEWTMFDYSQMVENILQVNYINDVTIICHSFGFRVAMLLNKKIQINRIIVTGGAGIKKEKYYNFIKKINENNVKIMLKSGKFKNLFNKVASADYLTLSATNRKTFKNIVNLNLKFALKFNCPMLLFWGHNDTATPIWIAKKIRKKNNAKLIITESNHFAYLEQNAKFNHETLTFLMSKQKETI